MDGPAMTPSVLHCRIYKRTLSHFRRSQLGFRPTVLSIVEALLVSNSISRRRPGPSRCGSRIPPIPPSTWLRSLQTRQPVVTPELEVKKIFMEGTELLCDTSRRLIRPLVTAQDSQKIFATKYTA
jgi:hypothetical protein